MLPTTQKGMRPQAANEDNLTSVLIPSVPKKSSFHKEMNRMKLKNEREEKGKGAGSLPAVT